MAVSVWYNAFSPNGDGINDELCYTVENAARDHHKINLLFKKFYTSKWVATGISKGEHTSTFYRAYFPKDVDVSVAYVAPLNFTVEDRRHEPYIANEKQDDLNELNEDKLNIASYIVCVHSSMTSTR
ncbi:MAG: hypothetical protein U9N53_00805 [Bacteroidota bacterium]|nr:hypothetical protein [Bacteroidota bacterium]